MAEASVVGYTKLQGVRPRAYYDDHLQGPKCCIHVRTTTAHLIVYRFTPNKVPNYPIQLLFPPCDLHVFTTARKLLFDALERI